MRCAVVQQEVGREAGRWREVGKGAVCGVAQPRWIGKGMGQSSGGREETEQA